jgi:hypothetical protein
MLDNQYHAFQWKKKRNITLPIGGGGAIPGWLVYAGGCVPSGPGCTEK